MDRQQLLKSFLENWHKHIDLPKGAGVLVACSGGPDSLALLDILAGLQARLGIKLWAAHFEHGIRGEASRADAAFVEDFCRQRGIPCYMGMADVPGEAARSGESLETAARRLRYGFLRQVTGELSRVERCVSVEIAENVSTKSAKENSKETSKEDREGSQRSRAAAPVFIATAHHMDDQAETLLMHLLRGSGLQGLGGIRPRQGDVIRPLLFARKADLTYYCEIQGLAPRHDATNDEADCLRNKIRLELLPLLQREYNPQLVQGLCRLAELARGDEDFLAEQTEKAWRQLVISVSDGLMCGGSRLLALPVALQRRLLQRMAGEISGSTLPFNQVEALRELAQKGRTGTALNLSGQLLGRFSYKNLYIMKKNIPFSENDDTIHIVGVSPENAVYPLQIPGVALLPDGRKITAELSDRRPDRADISDGLTIYGDWDECSGPLVARHRLPGDRVSVGTGTKKLKDFLIDAKIPREARDSLWLVADEAGILWLPGVRRFNRALADGETKRFFILHLD